MAWIAIDDYTFPGGWADPSAAPARGRECCTQLEAGGILYFQKPPFDLPLEDREFLLSQKQSSFKGHKNISYRPQQNMLRGDSGETPADTRRLLEIMRRFSWQATDFLTNFLWPYTNQWKIDFASFRPLEEQGRDLSVHKRNDLMHVDAFPSRPTRGGRILRVFANINPQEPRVWQVTEPFEAIAARFAVDAGLKNFARGAASPARPLWRMLGPAMAKLGIKGAAGSPYDKFMLRFHDYLKENQEYQQNYPKTRIEFPPGSSWLVYTDTVPHAVLSGRYALEQTYIIPAQAMVAPDKAPIRILEKMCGTPLGN